MKGCLFLPTWFSFHPLDHMNALRRNHAAKSALCVLVLFALSFAAAAERHSDLFYTVLLSPFSITGLPGYPSYAVYFGCALLYLLLLTVLAASTRHRMAQIAGWILWLLHFAGVLWLLYWSDWHPFTRRISPGILLTLLFAGFYLYWTYAIISPIWRTSGEA